jgi:integrase
MNRETLEAILSRIGDDIAGLRDAALIRVAYDTMCRRSELVALALEDVDFGEDGTATVMIRRSKTDQEGVGSVRFIAADTVRALRAWITAAGICTGPLYRTLRNGVVGGALDEGDVSRIYKRRGGDEFSGHSTRVGAAQDMASAGLELPEIMQAGGWKTPGMVARYTERMAAQRGAAAKLAAAQGRHLSLVAA